MYSCGYKEWYHGTSGVGVADKTGTTIKIILSFPDSNCYRLNVMVESVLCTVSTVSLWPGRGVERPLRMKIYFLIYFDHQFFSSPD